MLLPYCLAAAALAQARPQPVPVVSAQAVNDSLGMNVHMEYTDGRYADVGAVLKDLAYLGITRVRDGVPQPDAWLPHGQGIAAMDQLAADGIRFDLVVSATTVLSTDLAQMQALDAVKPGAVLSVEGPNEINNAPVHAPGLTNEQAATAFQRQLYAAVHSVPALAQLPVLYFTGGGRVDLAGTHGVADVANSHQYPHNGEQPGRWLAASWADNFTMPLGYPWQLTETGYYTEPTSTDWGGVDAATQARLLLNTVMDAARLGIEATYIYQLLDPYPYSDPRAAGADGHLGLFAYDGSPKPAAVALRALRMQLAGAAAAGHEAPVHEAPVHDLANQVTVTGMPATGHALALAKGDGTLLIALWNEVPAWDSATRQPLHPPPVPVRVQVRGYSSGRLLDPVSGATRTVRAESEGFRIDVPDSVVLLALRVDPHL